MVDRVVISTSDTGPEKPATSQAQTDAAAQQQQQQQTNDTRPSWLPDNFKTVEDYIKSSDASRAELTKTQQELASLKKGEKPADAAKAEGEAAKTDAEKKEAETIKALESKGLDVNAMSQRFWDTGKIADEDFAALEKAGISREVAQDYAELQKDRQERNEEKLITGVGGKEKFNAMAQWAQTGYSKEQVTAFNTALSSNNFAQMQQALSALDVAYTKANGSDPALRVDGGAGATTGTVYRDVTEMVRDMNDPRYKSSEAFRAEVAQKVHRSKI